jgi:hypothetical protein
MAVTITRSPWIDDDGSGTTGTVINNAVKTDLYNQIDTALAKVAQLAGGNSFNGTQSVVNGSFLVGTGAGVSNSVLGLTIDGALNTGMGVQNTNPSNGAFYLAFYNSAVTLAGYINQTGATTVAYTTTSDARLKDDAGRATDLAALRALIVHDFTWKADGGRDRGIFAQDAHALYPRAVMAGTDETTEAGALARPWMTDYSKFVPDLIVGWQQHELDLAALRAELVTLKGSHDAQ